MAILLGISAQYLLKYLLDQIFYREKFYLIKILADITVLCPPSPTQYTRNR